MNEISYMYLYVSSDFIEYIFELQEFYKLKVIAPKSDGNTLTVASIDK